jgi:biotin carboxyl carrier protein
MEYKLQVNQDKVHVDVDSQEDQRLRVVVDENIDKNLHDVHYNIISEHRILMTVKNNGLSRQVNAYVSDSPEGKAIVINGKSYLVKDLDIQGQRIKKGNAPEMPDSITPPTPAVVVKIHVQTGDHVEKGQAVIVVSAMKMETTLCAPYNGTVLAVNTAINDKVAPGQILVDIERADTSGKKGDN